jgi:isopentenyl-diphosphate delta-isomerase
MNEDEEILDLVDDQDKVIGQVPRRVFAAPAHFPAGNMRAAELFIVNSKGQLWVPKRSLHKRQWPGGFDFSAAEHVATGETYQQAMIRGLQEELNISATPEDIKQLGKLPPEPGMPIFRTIYRLRQDMTPQYNPDDFMSAEWLTPTELLGRIKAGEPTKNTVPSGVATFFEGNI